MKKFFIFLLFLLCLSVWGQAQKELILCTTGRGLDNSTSIGIDSEMWNYIQKWATLKDGSQDASVTAVRLHIEWNQYEPTLGDYKGAKLVAALQAIKSLKPNMKLALHFSYLRPGANNDSYFADEDVARLADGTKAQDDIAHTAVSVFSATARTRFINFVNNAMSAISAYHNDLLYVQMGNSDAEEFIIPIINKNGYHQPAYYEEKALQSWRNEYLPCRYPGQSSVTWGGNTYNISEAPPYSPANPGWYGDFNNDHGKEYHRFASWGLMRLYKQFRDAVKGHNSNIKVLYFTPGFGTGQGNIRSMHSATLPAAFNEFDGIYTSDGTHTGDTWRKIMALDVLKGTNPNKIAAIEFDPIDLGQQPGQHGVWPNMLTEWFARGYKHGADYIHFAMHYWNDEIDHLAPAIAAIKSTYITPNYQPPARQNAVTKNIYPDVFTEAFLFDNTWSNLGGSNWGTSDNNPVSLNMSDDGYWVNINSCTPVSTCEYNISASGPSGNIAAGSTVTLNSTISGQSSGVNYSWSGPGISGSNTNATVTFTAPSNAGTYTYTLTTTKSGCNNKLATVSVAVVSSGGGGSYTQSFNNFFSDRLESMYGSHVSAIVGCTDNVLYTYSHGITADQKIEIMSLSKWTTAAIIMMLVKEEKLQLSDKVGDYIESWAGNGKHNVTIRQLLAHTSGVPVQTAFDERTDMDLEEAVNNIALIPLEFEPGTRYLYGSSSYKVAAMVAEKIERKRWKVIFAERLGMLMPNASYPNDPPYNEDNPSPGYGLKVSTNEYANFMKMILNHGWFNGIYVMDSSSIAIMEEQHNFDGGVNNYGLGLFRDSDSTGLIQAWHPGASGGFTWINRKKNFYGVILSRNGDEASRASRDFKDNYAGVLLGNNICGGTNPQPCEYSVTPTGPTSSVNINTSVTLNSTCSGQCSGVSYSWSGTGISGSNTSSSVTFNAPSTAGTYTYTLTTSKSGCANQTKTIQIIVVDPGNGSTTCVNLSDQCSGNSSEIRNYAISMPSAGSFTVKLIYKAHEKPSIVRLRLNNGSWQTFNVAQTAIGVFVETTLGSLSLNSGNNTIDLASGDGYVCFRQFCAEAACSSTPSTPSLNASPSSIVNGANTQVTLSASGCSGGTITWSNGLGTGVSKTVSPTSTTTYTATCSIGSCVSAAANVVVTVTEPGGSNPCNLVDKATIGTWNGLSVQARQYTVNGNPAWLIVTAVTGSSTDKHFPRGANFAARTDINWTSGAVSQTCFAGGETSWGGLTKPSGITIPSGYSAGTEPDGAEYFHQTCTPPSAPSLSASPSSIVGGANTQVTLSASGCSGGTINWSHSLGSGTGKTVSPSSTTTYTATCTVGSCTSTSSSVVVTVTPGTFNQCLESETSTGNGTVTNDPNASNGSTRGEQNNNNHYVDYSVTGVPVAGTYYVTLRYYSSSAPTVSVKVNSENPSNLSLANSGSWNIVSATHQFSVNLLAGNNTIRIAGVSGGSCRQDRICVSNVSGNPSVLDTRTTDELINSQLNVYPNPAKGMLDVVFSLEKGKKGVIVITDLQGRVIHQQAVVGQGNHKERINLLKPVSGLFFIQLKTDKGTEVKKIIITK